MPLPKVPASLHLHPRAEGTEGIIIPAARTGWKELQISASLWGCIPGNNFPAKRLIGTKKDGEGQSRQRNGEENKLKQRCKSSIERNQKNQQGNQQKSSSFPEVPKHASFCA